MRARSLLPQSRRGLTLVEVLVALVLTSFIVLGTWRFFASASDSMSLFAGVSIVDERLSLAADLLASDARRAGMFGTPHSDNDPLVCPQPSTPLRAVLVQDGASLPTFAFGHNLHVDPDICIFQSPVTSNLFRPVSIAGPTITLSVADPNLPTTEAAFETLFTSRTLRITSPSGFNQFVDVTDLNFEDRTVTVSPAPALLEDNGVCGVEGIGGPDHEVSVLTWVRYQILPDPDNPTEETLLVREELDPTLTNVLAGTRLVVAENVVDLQCWADRDAGAGLGGPDFAPDTQLGDDSGSADVSGTSSETQRVRILHFTIAGRTDREFTTHTHQAKAGAYDLLATWDVDGDTGNAALALTVGQQVEISTLAVRRLQ